MVYGGAIRPHLLIGGTTSGHHQIELACNACHTTPFGGAQSLQAACVNCHAEDLKRSKDTHPAKKFADPRNADRLEKLDATECVTCHREHKPAITSAMGVTLPTDYCALCHQDIGKERPSHLGLAFSTCASAGCHNFHDNRALYEDFLTKHADEPDLKPKPVAKLRLAVNEPAQPRKPLTRAQADAPPDKLADTAAVADWLAPPMPRPVSTARAATCRKRRAPRLRLPGSPIPASRHAAAATRTRPRPTPKAGTACVSPPA